MGLEDTVPLHEAVRSRYLNYALSVITSRALPDIRDGLKPVQRRILYSMFASLRLYPTARFRKCATIVGDVMGKYHPHGDSAIYDAMARMAQSFSLRAPLVDGHGNFGSVDGDKPAAMRYTEARLQPLAMELLEEIRYQTVPFRPNFDGTLSEPVVLPSTVPNLLVNGATGIAVGMATNIPPHNLGEVVSAALYLVKSRIKTGNAYWPKVRIATLIGRFVKGPDFPTGGRILNTREELIRIYSKGEGPLTIRGDFDLSEKGHIVITSIPYGINKGLLIEKIAGYIGGGHVPQLTDIRDESTEEIRIVLDLKSGTNPNPALGYLYKRTPLETRFHVNLTALVPTENDQVSKPQKFNLCDALQHFLDFRLEVVTRRLDHELEQLMKRIHILEGFQIIFDALDEAIRIIRSSRNRADAGIKLQDRFKLSDIQTDAILDTRLYKLAQMEILAIQDELKAKRERVDEILRLLDDVRLRWRIVENELKEVKKKYADPRRTTIGEPDKEVYTYSEEDFIVNERVILVVTRDGWIKRQRSYASVDTIRVRDGDRVGWVMPGRTRSTVTVWSNFGRAYTARVNDIPMSSGYGIPIQKMFDLRDREKVVGVTSNDSKILGTSKNKENPLGYLVSFSRGGRCVRLDLQVFAEPSTKVGRIYMRLPKKDEVVKAWWAAGAEYACVATHRGRGLAFVVNEIPLRKNAVMGVLSIKLDTGDYVLGAVVSSHKTKGLTVKTVRGRREVVRATKSYLIRRAGKGRAIINKGTLAEVEDSVVEHPS